MGREPAFDWQCHPEAARLVSRWVHKLVEGIPELAELESRMLGETGTRLVDWIDHLQLPLTRSHIEQMQEVGFVCSSDSLGATDKDVEAVWMHGGGLFPTILQREGGCPVLSIKVDSVVNFLEARAARPGFSDEESLFPVVQGQPGGPLRMATVAATAVGQFQIIERHGDVGFAPRRISNDTIAAAQLHHEQFRLRERDHQVDGDAFQKAADLFQEAARDLGVDWACDLFFAAERSYWQSRNLAARIQKARQDRLGLGWANHDHHTYRSSRHNFARLIELLEQMGFQLRERFYGGAEAGWGAQVLEQPNCGIVIFADVDLSPEEVAGDFSRQGLSRSRELGTVGLWCALHGEAMLQAGMHHLECQFDFEEARSQLAKSGIETMSPFTDFAYLRQAFTAGEVWGVHQKRIDDLVERGSITPTQADRFRASGSIGSHLEILQRDDGYKGFNQTGISEIIRSTDPRQA